MSTSQYPLNIWVESQNQYAPSVAFPLPVNVVGGNLVSQIIPGTGVTISPTTGIGAVTINATGTTGGVTGIEDGTTNVVTGAVQIKSADTNLTVVGNPTTNVMTLTNAAPCNATTVAANLPSSVIQNTSTSGQSITTTGSVAALTLAAPGGTVPSLALTDAGSGYATMTLQNGTNTLTVGPSVDTTNRILALPPGGGTVVSTANIATNAVTGLNGTQGPITLAGAHGIGVTGTTTITIDGSAVTGAVSSVSAADTTLTITPTTGSVTAAVNAAVVPILAQVNTFTGSATPIMNINTTAGDVAVKVQNGSNGNPALELTSVVAGTYYPSALGLYTPETASATTPELVKLFAPLTAASGGYSITLPASTTTLAGLGTVQTFTGANTFSPASAQTSITTNISGAAGLNVSNTNASGYAVSTFVPNGSNNELMTCKTGTAYYPPTIAGTVPYTTSGSTTSTTTTLQWPVETSSTARTLTLPAGGGTLATTAGTVQLSGNNAFTGTNSFAIVPVVSAAIGTGVASPVLSFPGVYKNTFYHPSLTTSNAWAPLSISGLNTAAGGTTVAFFTLSVISAGVTYGACASCISYGITNTVTLLYGSLPSGYTLAVTGQQLTSGQIYYNLYNATGATVTGVFMDASITTC